MMLHSNIKEAKYDEINLVMFVTYIILLENYLFIYFLKQLHCFQWFPPRLKAKRGRKKKEENKSENLPY